MENEKAKKEKRLKRERTASERGGAGEEEEDGRRQRSDRGKDGWKTMEEVQMEIRESGCWEIEAELRERDAKLRRRGRQMERAGEPEPEEKRVW